MKTISVLEFRKNAKQVVQWARQGKRMIMTYRGEPVCRLEPIQNETLKDNDPFYRLADLADREANDLNNQEIDRILYEGTDIC